MFTRKFALLAVVVVAIAALSVACGGSSGGSSSGGGNNVNITMTDFKFDPATINAKAGETVNVTVVNKGQTTHTIVVKDAGNFKLSADAGKTATGSFKAPSQAGAYDFDCDVPGHADQGMVGKLVVQ